MERVIAKSVLVVDLTWTIEKLAFCISLALKGGYLAHGVLDAFTDVEFGSMKLHF
jgi:hypothetical protein